MADAAAMNDPLIAAMVGKLPAPAPGAYTRGQRVNWLKMMVMAFNEAYGVEEPIGVSELLEPARPLRFTAPAIDEAAGDQVPLPARLTKLSSNVTEEHIAMARYRVDPQGFALFGETPIDPADLPADAVLYDERTAIERGAVDTILWKTSGAIAADKLPPLQLRAA